MFFPTPGLVWVAPEAKLKVFDDELAHLLWEGSLRGQQLQNLSEYRRVSQRVIACKHEQSLFLLDSAHDHVRIFLCKKRTAGY